MGVPGTGDSYNVIIHKWFHLVLMSTGSVPGKHCCIPKLIVIEIVVVIICH